VDKSVIMTVAGAANYKKDFHALEKEGGAGMWTGFEFGLSEHDIIEKLQSKLNISLQKAQEYLNMFGQQFMQPKERP
jgi:hypothetical protein